MKRIDMPRSDGGDVPGTECEQPVLDAWRINAAVTARLVKAVPPAIWGTPIPASPRRAVRNLAAHLHNTRCMWVQTLAAGTTVAVPPRVDPFAVTRRDLSSALTASDRAILLLLDHALRNGGAFPGVSSAFVWGAIPRNAMLFVAYALSHEAHHRGQLVMCARELGHKFPPRALADLWQWSARLKESSR